MQQGTVQREQLLKQLRERVLELEKSVCSSEAGVQQLVKEHRQLQSRAQSESRVARAAEAKAAAIARDLKAGGHKVSAVTIDLGADASVQCSYDGGAAEIKAGSSDECITFLDSLKEKVARLESDVLSESKGVSGGY